MTDKCNSNFHYTTLYVNAYRTGQETPMLYAVADTWGGGGRGGGPNILKDNGLLP